MSKLWLITLGVLSVPAIPANAMSITHYRAMMETAPRTAEFYVTGVARGFEASNAVLSNRGDARLFCVPRKLPLNTRNYIDILDDELERRGTAVTGNELVEIVLFRGLERTFPC